MVRPLGALVFLAVLMSACGGDEAPEAGWAIVKVEVDAGEPGLQSICFEAECRSFDESADTRSAEFSAYVEQGARFEVLLIGDQPDEGASAGAPIGGCTLVRLGDGAAEFVSPCDAGASGS